MGFSTKTIIPAFAAGLLAASTLSAFATEGYFQHGYGARSKALAGAGVADSADATAPATNPAGLVRAGSQINAAFSLFSPRRQFTGSGFPGFTPSGTQDSEHNYFGIPNLAVSYALDEDSAIGLMVIGNGGMNTAWKASPRTTPPCFPPFTAPGGVYCGGNTGVDMMQMIVGATYARRMGSFSFGVTPMFVAHRFKAKGLGVFAGISTDPTNLTNNGFDWAYGGGVRAGVEVEVTDRFRIGLAGQTPLWMSEFDKYSGLFAGGGDFDIPANITAGVAFDVTPDFTVMLDYKRIWYSSVDAIANPSTNVFACIGGNPNACLGGRNGAGFGWQDTDIFKVGFEWDATPDLTLRAGYAYNTQPINSRDVMFNILAPGVVQHHITGGFKYDLNESSSIEFAAMYAPPTDVKGRELNPPFGAGAFHNIDLSMHQFDLTLGYPYRFGAPDPIMPDEPLITKY